jgi:PAS domain S-box-containing protein
MKIKARLRLNNWISLLVVVLLAFSLAWSFREMDRADRNENLVEEMRKAAFERVSLRDDYLLYREERARLQWVAKSETLRRLMDTASERFTAMEDKDLLQEARKDFEATFSSFSSVLDKHKREEHRAGGKLAFDEADSRQIGQVLLKAYTLQDSIGRLYESTGRASTRARTRGIAFILFFIVGGIIAMAVNSAALNRIVAKRVMTLQEGVGIIGGGNLDHRINTEGDDELTALARESNEMAARLKESHTSVDNLQREITARKRAEQELRAVSSYQESLLSAIPDIIMEVDGNKVYTWANKPGMDFFGEDVIGTEAAFYFEGEQETYRIVRPLFNGSMDVIYLESWQRRKDGEKRLLSWRCRVLKDENGRVTGALSSARDITDRKQAEEEIRRLNADLEQRVLDRTAQLKAANKELEAFSYSVSHDLRAPLRSVDGFSQALLEEYQEKLDDTGKGYLERVRKATQLMGSLIEDMLKLSRVTRFDFRRESVDLSEMVREILQTMRQGNPDRCVHLIVREGVVVQGDPFLMRIALSNLLDNAWKFTGREAQPRIEFGTTVRDGETACFIRDNGAGFDMAYAGKLFGAFQRLHTTDQFPGTGIGLATVQRIIHRHGGQIRAEGEVGKGATFYFTLPPQVMGS